MTYRSVVKSIRNGARFIEQRTYIWDGYFATAERFNDYLTYRVGLLLGRRRNTCRVDRCVASPSIHKRFQMWRKDWTGDLCVIHDRYPNHKVPMFKGKLGKSFYNLMRSPAKVTC